MRETTLRVVNDDCEREKQAASQDGNEEEQSAEPRIVWIGGVLKGFGRFARSAVDAAKPASVVARHDGLLPLPFVRRPARDIVAIKDWPVQK
jgi:hypothetical protein